MLGFVPRIVLASLIGYLAGQFLNAYVLVRLKQRFGEGRMWVRLVSSTVVGEFADTALFCFIAFAGSGIFPTWGSLISYTVVGYLYKVAIEIVFLPVTYAVIGWVKRREPSYTAGAGRELRVVVADADYTAASALLASGRATLHPGEGDADVAAPGSGVRVRLLPGDGDPAHPTP